MEVSIRCHPARPEDIAILRTLVSAGLPRPPRTPFHPQRLASSVDHAWVVTAGCRPLGVAALFPDGDRYAELRYLSLAPASLEPSVERILIEECLRGAWFRGLRRVIVFSSDVSFWRRFGFREEDFGARPAMVWDTPPPRRTPPADVLLLPGDAPGRQHLFDLLRGLTVTCVASPAEVSALLAAFTYRLAVVTNLGVCPREAIDAVPREAPCPVIFASGHWDDLLVKAADAKGVVRLPLPPPILEFQRAVDASTARMGNGD
jgi:N-acetylglutamate synthase-like GNAT family acetyltransferase